MKKNAYIVHLVLGRANPHRMNGVNRVVHNLATAQVSEGMNVAVWGMTASYSKPAEVERSYITRWFRPSWKSILPTKELIYALKIHRPTYIHLHGGFIPLFYFLSKKLKKKGIPFCITPHGTYTQGAMSGNSVIKKKYFSFFEKRMLRRAEVVQCLGHAEQSDLLDLDKKVNTVLIPNGQNRDELKGEGLKSTQGFVFGYCGRVTRWQKGLDLLMDGYMRYKQQGGAAKLWIVGDGEYLCEMQKQASNYLLDNDVVFYGSRFGEEKIAVLKQVDVFFHTSRNEGLPTAVLEATALGIPCIVTPFTSMDTYIERYNAGWIVTDLDDKLVTKAMWESEKEYDSGDIKLKGINAARMAEECFDWGKIALQTKAVYEKSY